MKRNRTKKDTFVAKRYDTKISTIEKKYGVDLGARYDMKLGNYLKKKGYKSLSDMLQKYMLSLLPLLSNINIPSRGYDVYSEFII